MEMEVPTSNMLCECNRVVCNGDCIFSDSCIHCLVAQGTKDFAHVSLIPDDISELKAQSLACTTVNNEFSCPYESDVCIQTTEMHTGGMPVRIIESGFPVAQGATVREKVEDIKANFDNYRKLIIHEPHGHRDMYGALLVAPDDPMADIGVVFMDNNNYATMCGHVTISLARYAVDRGLVRRPISSPETLVNVQAPCGLVRAYVETSRENNRIVSRRTRFESVPAFVIATDQEIEVEGLGKVTIDVSYGGSFYVFVEAADIGIDFDKSSSTDIGKAASALKAAAIKSIPIHHPYTKAFYYGVMVVDSRTKLAKGPSTNVCIFSDSATDRSPCGSGTTARVALMYHRGILQQGQAQTFRCGVTGSEFTGRPIRDAQVGENKAVIVEISGQGRYIGKSTLTLEKEDLLGKGFMVR